MSPWLNRLPHGTRTCKVHTKRQQKQVPGHHIQIHVKFLTLIRKAGEKTHRFQYTAIDDATRVSALKVYERHTLANVIDVMNYVIEKIPSGSKISGLTTAMSFRLNSTGMLKTKASATPTSNPVLLSSMVKWSDLTDPISRQNWPSGKISTTLQDHTVPTIE